MSDEVSVLIVGATRMGRRPKAGVTATKRINVRATEVQINDLREVAKFERRPMSDVIRDAIDSYVGDFSEGVIFTPSGDRFKPPS